jgi:hypothetical protein
VKFNSTSTKEEGNERDEEKIMKSIVNILEYSRIVKKIKSPISHY